MRHVLWLNAKELFQVRQRFLEKLQRLVVLQIADVLAQNGVVSFGQAESIFQFAATGKNGIELHPRSSIPRSMGRGT